MDHRCSYKYDICLMRISLVTMKTVTLCRGPACRCFVLYSTSLNIGLIFLNISVYSVHILKIFNKRLAICIDLPHSYCNIFLLYIQLKMLNNYMYLYYLDYVFDNYYLSEKWNSRKGKYLLWIYHNKETNDEIIYCSFIFPPFLYLLISSKYVWQCSWFARIFNIFIVW